MVSARLWQGFTRIAGRALSTARPPRPNLVEGPATARDAEPRDDYNRARNKALDWLEPRGFVAKKATLAKFGSRGTPIGMQTEDGRVGFRVEHDERSGAHINVWDHDSAKGDRPPHFLFDATPTTVDKITRHFVKEPRRKPSSSD